MYVECWGVECVCVGSCGSWRAVCMGRCVGMSMLRGTGVYGVHEYVRRERVHEIVLGVIHS